MFPREDNHSINNIQLGNIFIKHNDKWRGDYYLTEELTFSTTKSTAARFYLLKSGDTTILNGDRITINSGNKILSINDSNVIKLLDRDNHHQELNSFIIVNGTDNVNPITFDNTIYLISDKDLKTALKYDWGVDLINSQNNSENNLQAVNYKPHNHPNLLNGYYGDISSTNVFEFQLEKADEPITNLDSSHRSLTVTESKLSKSQEFLDGYKGIIMVVLLMVILILCILISK